MTGQGDPAAVRDAASLILVRRDGPRPRVLMGQRGRDAVFMPEKFVFPGGAVEAGDVALAAARAPDPAEDPRLCVDSDPAVARALPLAAVRELWEETGLRLGAPDPVAVARASEAPTAWWGVFPAGARPTTGALCFMFRAVTPPGRPRRFDARFFRADAEAVLGDPSDFSGADAELGRLVWIEIGEARTLPLPFITGVVLSELEAALADPCTARPAPYFRHDPDGSHFRML